MKGPRSKLGCFIGLLLLLASTNLPAQNQQNFPPNYAKSPRFKALVYYDPGGEEAHVIFSKQAVQFFTKLNYGDGFILDVTTDFSGYSFKKLKSYNIVIMLNGIPATKTSRKAFEQYMENGGGWLGFHFSGYNDKNTKWPWFVNFLGAGTFYCNNWPPQPAKLTVENPNHPVTKNLPPTFIAPESEWYQFNNGANNNSNVEVLLSLTPDNYPIGIKDVISFGDFPVVWTNKNYRMVYLNMGHGDDEFTDATQKLLFLNAFRWVISSDKNGDPFKK